MTQFVEKEPITVAEFRTKLQNIQRMWGYYQQAAEQSVQQHTLLPLLLPYGFMNLSIATVAPANAYVRPATELALSVKPVVTTNYAAMQAQPNIHQLLSGKVNETNTETMTKGLQQQVRDLLRGPGRHKIPWTPKETTATTAASQDTLQKTVEIE